MGNGKSAPTTAGSFLLILGAVVTGVSFTAGSGGAPRGVAIDDSLTCESFRPSKSSSKKAATKMTILIGSKLLRYQARSIVILLITTGVTGLSCAPFFTLEILSATSWPSTTSPKIV